MGQHPNLLQDRTYLDAVREALASGRSLDDIPGGPGWAGVVQAAETRAADPARVQVAQDAWFDVETQRFTTPDGTAPPGVTMNVTVHTAAQKLGSLASAAALTEKPRFVTAGRRLLLALVEVLCWTSLEDYHDNASPYARSSMSMGTSVREIGHAYDLLYHHLSKSERDRVRARIIERGLEPIYLDLAEADALRWPNGFTMIASGLGLGALAIHQEAEVGCYIRRATAAAVEFLDLHSPDGSMLESYGYGQVGIEPIAFLLVALERAGVCDAQGRPLAERISGHPTFPRILDYLTAFVTPDGAHALGLGDCQPLCQAGYGAYLTYRAWCGSAVASWLLSRAQTRHGWTRMALAGRRARPRKPRFQSAAFPVSGVAVLRDSRPDSPMLALKSGPAVTEVLHNHYDQNHVMLWHREKLLLWDPGYHRELYAFGTEGHNTLLVDGRGQDVVVEQDHEEKFRDNHVRTRECDLLWGLTGADLAEFAVANEADMAVGSAAHAYNKRVHRLRRFDRYAVFVKPDFFVLHDRLCAQFPRVFSLLFHGAPGSRLANAADGVRVVDGDAALDVRIASPAGVTPHARKALAKFDHAPYVEFALGRSKLTSATTLLMPCAPDGRPARIEFLERGQHGVAVWRPQGADLALFGFHDPPPFEWRGLRVDLFGVRVAVVRLDASGELRSATVLSPRLGAMTPVQGRADLA